MYVSLPVSHYDIFIKSRDINFTSNFYRLNIYITLEDWLSVSYLTHWLSNPPLCTWGTV
ncbi:hypothetical protein PT2222_140199 [Paraburkholderia tropica]